MTREELIEKTNAITNPSEQKAELFEVLDGLGIKYNPNNRCKKCLRDYWLTAKEALGLIESAADESDFNAPDATAATEESPAEEARQPGEETPEAEKPKPIYVFTHHRAVLVNGKRYDRFSTQDDLEWLHKKLGNGYAAEKM